MVKILYVVEPMIGIGPNIDANLIAKMAITTFPNVELAIVMDTQVPLKYTSSKVKWYPTVPWRFSPATGQSFDLQGRELDSQFKEDRKTHLLKVFNEFQPDALLLHNYISGSKWDDIVDFEMLPLIDLARKENRDIKIYSYLIGMIDNFEHMNQGDEEKFLNNVDRNIDTILLRSDNSELFFKTCPMARNIKDKFIPVGYSADNTTPSKIDGLEGRFIIVSAGGGDFGLNLFTQAIETCAYLMSAHNPISSYQWKLFLGPMQRANRDYLQEKIDKAGCNEKFELITDADEDIFLSYLTYNCFVSISQCGQRTFTNLEIAGAASIVIPREAGEFEQLYRAKYMEEMGRATLIHERDLCPQRLADAMLQVKDDIPRRLGLQMNGPRNLLQHISGDYENVRKG